MKTEILSGKVKEIDNGLVIIDATVVQGQATDIPHRYSINVPADFKVEIGMHAKLTLEVRRVRN